MGVHEPFDINKVDFGAAPYEECWVHRGDNEWPWRL